MLDLDVKKWSTEWGGKELKVETGKLARQADASCTVEYGGTMILATAVMSDEEENRGYFPLSVEFQEKLYATGKIKGSRFVKREGRPSDQAVTSGRLIDRSIRPLFDDRIRNEIQVVLTPLSVTEEGDTETASLIAASIALSISPIPWEGPLAGARIGRKDDELILNADKEDLNEGDLDIVVAGTPEKLVMVEGEADEMSEDDMKKAMNWGCEQLQPVIDLIEDIKSDVGQEKVNPLEEKKEYEEGSIFQEAKETAQKFVRDQADEMMYDRERKGRKERQQMVTDIKKKLAEFMKDQGYEEEVVDFAMDDVKDYVGRVVSDRIIENEQRLDGRDMDEVRPLNIEADLVPNIHGSAMFMRGDTQVLSTITLGAPGYEQTLDTMELDRTKRYMHHYFDAPFTYGDTGYMSGPSRRAIGHGMLAEKALRPVLPSEEMFPYAVRAVSEVLGSNGSSSMASICGSSLSLMTAGVPIKKHVAGIAMGLASNEQGDWKVFADLQDVEDSKGGMDFKIGGTRDGITTVQMDTKTHGLNWDMVDEAIEKSQKARLEIISQMEEVINEPKEELAKDAPRIETIKIDPDKIGDIIGPGGKTIRKITEDTGVEIDIKDDGRVLITAEDQESMQEATKIVETLTHEVKKGERYTGEVKRMEDFGVFVEILPGKQGLVHISNMEEDRTDHPSDLVSMGDEIEVKVVEIDDKDRINLSMKDV